MSLGRLFAQTSGAVLDPLLIMSCDCIECIGSVMKLTYFSQIYVIKVHPRTDHVGTEGGL